MQPSTDIDALETAKVLGELECAGCIKLVARCWELNDMECPACQSNRSRLHHQRRIARFYQILLLRHAPGALKTHHVEPEVEGEMAQLIEEMVTAP